MSFCQFCLDNKIHFKKDEPMKNHTSFKIGGNADCFVECGTAEELKMVVDAAREQGVPYFVLGKGSNLLVSDKGVRGVVISLGA